MGTQNKSIENALLGSALTTKGQFRNVDDFFEWFNIRGTANRFVVKEIPFEEMDNWCFSENPCRITHSSGKFFTIEGVRVKTNYESVKQWDQPIIYQPEIGILGIIVKQFNGVYHCLMQAKMEPGNVNNIQLSPTVQATKSNYTRVHKGKLPTYLEYFIDRSKSNILIDQLQTEQGARFMGKRNRNMVVEVTEDIPMHGEFCWLPIGQIKQLLIHNNIVNMDARTVLSCLPLISRELRLAPISEHQISLDYFVVEEHHLKGFSKDLFFSMNKSVFRLCSEDEIISWFTDMKSKYNLLVERIPLDSLDSWIQTDSDIHHKTEQYFSVIAVSVEANNREVITWTQPLLKQVGHGLVGFLTQNISGTLHFLVRACLEPGNRDVMQIGPTIAYSSRIENTDKSKLPTFVNLFLEASPEQIQYDTIQSEEGGRFYHFQNRYMIIEMPSSIKLELPDIFTWMTLGQIIDFVKHGYFNIEARNLISCLNVFK